MRKQKTYKGMTRKELLEKVIAARIAECKAINIEKYGKTEDYPNYNEKPSAWASFYKTCPMTSKSDPFALANEYERYYGKAVNG